METTSPCSATNISSCSCRLGVIQERTPLIRFSRNQSPEYVRPQIRTPDVATRRELDLLRTLASDLGTSIEPLPNEALRDQKLVREVLLGKTVFLEIRPYGRNAMLRHAPQNSNATAPLSIALRLPLDSYSQAIQTRENQ